MFTALITLVIIAEALVLVVLAVVVAAIRRETPTAELSSQAPGLMAALVRRLLGVGVRRPDPASEQREECFAGHAAVGHEGR
jgi:hypothetical protein